MERYTDATMWKFQFHLCRILSGMISCRDRCKEGRHDVIMTVVVIRFDNEIWAAT